MGRDDEIFLYVGSYADEADALLDYQDVLELHAEGTIGTYDAAIIVKDDKGKVQVRKHEKPTQHGIVVGALIGLLFGPVGVVAGGAVGGLIEHFRNGLSRHEMKELGDELQDGNAALVVIGKSKLDKQLDKMFRHARRRIEKEIKADRKQFEKSLEEASV